MVWTWEEVLMGGQHIIFIMDDKRVVCYHRQNVIDVHSPGEDVERIRREFKSIVEQHTEIDRYKTASKVLDIAHKIRTDQLTEARDEVERLRTVVKVIRGRVLLFVDALGDLQDDLDEYKVWVKKYHIETERLCKGEKINRG